MKRIKSYFVTGLLVVVPLYITIYVLALIAGFMDNIIYILPRFLRPHAYLPVDIPGLGIIYTVIAVIAVGALTSNFAGKRLLHLGERVLARIPLLSMIYNASKQFMETFFSKDREGFRKVVLMEFPRKGVWSIGFMTGRTRGEVKDKTRDGTVNVFLPTTPNPTSGFYMVAHESEVIALEMKVEDAFKVILTGGIVVPPSGNIGAQAGKEPAAGAK